MRDHAHHIQLTREESPDGSFAIRFLNLSVGADGTLEAALVAGGPASEAAVNANSCYMMPTGAGMVPPAAGDAIAVELRGGMVWNG